MRRIIAITAMVVFFLGLLGFFIATAIRPRMPAMAAEAVSMYLKSGSAGAGQPLILQHAALASRPDLFEPAFSSASVGDSLYFVTSRSFTPVVPPDPRRAITPEAVGGYGHTGGRALPYPPQEVWCLTLVREGQAVPALAFAALHQDMYNAQWIIHEAAGDAATVALQKHLGALGCDLGL